MAPTNRTALTRDLPLFDAHLAEAVRTGQDQIGPGLHANTTDLFFYTTARLAGRGH